MKIFSQQLEQRRYKIRMKERMLPMLQECQLNNLEIEFDQIQDSLLMSRNNMADSSTSNFFISQKVCQSDGRTRMSSNCLRRVHMLNLGQYPVTKILISPMATLKKHMTTIQFLSPRTLCMLLTSKPKI